MKINILTFTLIFIILSGCVSPPRKETARFTSTHSFDDTLSLMDQMINSCWNRRPTNFKDGFSSIKSFNENSVLLTLGRINFDIPFMPFAKITITGSKDGDVKIYLHEGDVFIGKRWRLDENIARWLNGDKTCND